MHRTRIKICGLTREEDVRTAVEAGADAIGFVFYPSSPRFVDFERAAELARLVPPFVTIVGLFVNAGRDYVENALKTVTPLVLFRIVALPAVGVSLPNGRPKIVMPKPSLIMLADPADD